MIKMVKLRITKVRAVHLGLDLKGLFRQNANLLISCSLLRKRVPGLGFAEPEGAPVLSCPSKWEAEQISMVRVI